ncbi:MAG: hypothetical protein N2Z21_03660 [Candidatus Sumerlaeaceae bacterium]|nr:hypothetical protein [Candidatus Sumerlaeaceae bacterium]
MNTWVCGVSTALAALVAVSAWGGNVEKESRPSNAVGPRAVMTLSSTYVAIAFDDTNGDLTMTTLLGDPDNPHDDNKRLLFGDPDPWSSAVTIRVDGSDYWNFDGRVIGTLVSGPTNDGNTNTTVFEVAGIRVTQEVSIVATGSSGREDTMLHKLIMTNIDQVPHEVGARIMYDTQLGNNDGAPFRVPGLGEITFEHEVVGTVIPAFYQVFDDFVNPTVIAQGTLLGSSAVAPDRVVWANWEAISDTPWDFTIDPDRDLSDSSVGIYWNPVALPPGETRTVATYYGLGSIGVDMTPPVAVGITAGTQVECINGSLVPNPFPVVTYLAHVVPSVEEPLTNVFVRLTVPPGVVYASSPAVYALSGLNLNIGETYMHTFNVEVLGIPGNYTYTIEVGADNYPTKTIEKQLVVQPGCESVTGCDLRGQWLQVVPRYRRPGVVSQFLCKLQVFNDCDTGFRNILGTLYLANGPSLDQVIAPIRWKSGPMAAHSTRIISMKLNVPRNMPTTGKYIIAFIDADNKVAESDEANNIIVYGPLP